jgi:hypothetical protein
MATLNGCRCSPQHLNEIAPGGEKTTFAWLTNLAVRRQSVMAIADHVGRLRVKIEPLTMPA